VQRHAAGDRGAGPGHRSQRLACRARGRVHGEAPADASLPKRASAPGSDAGAAARARPPPAPRRERQRVAFATRLASTTQRASCARAPSAPGGTRAKSNTRSSAPSGRTPSPAAARRARRPSVHLARRVAASRGAQPDPLIEPAPLRRGAARTCALDRHRHAARGAGVNDRSSGVCTQVRREERNGCAVAMRRRAICHHAAPPARAPRRAARVRARAARRARAGRFERAA
jgi:hypothetical protein